MLRMYWVQVIWPDKETEYYDVEANSIDEAVQIMKNDIEDPSQVTIEVLEEYISKIGKDLN